MEGRRIAKEISSTMYVSDNPIRLSDFRGLISGFADSSNCLGYAMTGDPGHLMQPDTDDSMDEFLESYGWKCYAISEASECRCGCNQQKIIVMLPPPRDSIKKQPGCFIGCADDSWKENIREKNRKLADKAFEKKIPNWGEEVHEGNYHAVRAEGGCSNNYTQLDRLSSDPQVPKPVSPDDYSHMTKKCCCK